MTNYKDKYLKYKLKYIKEKQLAGAAGEDISQDMDYPVVTQNKETVLDWFRAKTAQPRNITGSFRHKHTFGGGKSGAFVFMVEDDQNKQSMIKYYTDAWTPDTWHIPNFQGGLNAIDNQRPFREVLTLCLLSGTRGFTNVYDVARIPEPINWIGRKYAINDRQGLALHFSNAPGLDLNKFITNRIKDPSNCKLILQIALELLNLLKRAANKLGGDFQHFDFHPENIKVNLDVEQQDDFYFDEKKYGKITFQHPAITVIDFDLVSNKDLKFLLTNSEAQLLPADINQLPDHRDKITGKSVVAERTWEMFFSLIGNDTKTLPYKWLTDHELNTDIRNWYVIIYSLLYWAISSGNASCAKFFELKNVIPKLLKKNDIEECMKITWLLYEQLPDTYPSTRSFFIQDKTIQEQLGNLDELITSNSTRFSRSKTDIKQKKSKEEPNKNRETNRQIALRQRRERMDLVVGGGEAIKYITPAEFQKFKVRLKKEKKREYITLLKELEQYKQIHATSWQEVTHDLIEVSNMVDNPEDNWKDEAVDSAIKAVSDQLNRYVPESIKDMLQTYQTQFFTKSKEVYQVGFYPTYDTTELELKFKATKTLKFIFETYIQTRHVRFNVFIKKFSVTVGTEALAKNKITIEFDDSLVLSVNTTDAFWETWELLKTYIIIKIKNFIIAFFVNVDTDFSLFKGLGCNIVSVEQVDFDHQNTDAVMAITKDTVLKINKVVIEHKNDNSYITISYDAPSVLGYGGPGEYELVFPDEVEEIDFEQILTNIYLVLNAIRIDNVNHAITMICNYNTDLIIKSKSKMGLGIEQQSKLTKLVSDSELIMYFKEKKTNNTLLIKLLKDLFSLVQQIQSLSPNSFHKILWDENVKQLAANFRSPESYTFVLDLMEERQMNGQSVVSIQRIFIAALYVYIMNHCNPHWMKPPQQLQPPPQLQSMEI